MTHSTLSAAEARTALAEDATVASGVLCALKALFKDEWLNWEPETVWKELEHQGCEISLGNRQQAMAGRNLLTTGRFFYDALVFDATCAAFGNAVLSLEMPESSHVAHLAWGVDEAEVICREHEDPMLEFDREAVEFTAHQLQQEGFVVAPKELAYAQEALNRRYPRTEELEVLRAAVSKAYHELGRIVTTEGVKTAAAAPYPETARGVQLARLAAVEVFLQDRRAARAADLKKRAPRT